MVVQFAKSKSEARPQAPNKYERELETVTKTHNTSPTCDLCNACDIQDEQHVLFHCNNPHVVSLCRTYASVLSCRFWHCVCFYEPGQQQ